MLRLFVLRSENDSKALYGFLRSNWLAMAQAGKPLSVLVSEYKQKRRDVQNKKYWAWLDEVAKDAWVDGKQFSKERWHLSFAGEFLGWEELPNGREAPISTATLSVSEFSDYMEKVSQYASENLGVILT